MAAQWFDEEAPTHKMTSVRRIRRDDDTVPVRIERGDGHSEAKIAEHEELIARLSRRLDHEPPG